MTHRPRLALVRPRAVAVAMVLMLAAGQVAGCAGTDTTGRTTSGKPLGSNTDLLVAGAAILSVIAAGLAVESSGD